MIKIIAGVYGLRKNGRVEPITAKSEPISLAKAEEARLVKAGVAEYVDGGNATPANGPAAPGTTEATPANGPAAEAKTVENMSYNELKAKAAEMGLTVDGNKKQDYIDAINAALEELEIAEAEEGEMPTFNAENTVVD